MKKLYTLFCILLASYANAQNYNNEWIAISSTNSYSLQQYFKISVWKEGIYRLTYNDLDNAATPLNNWTNPDSFQIFNNGVEQFIDVADVNSNNTFDNGDYIEFYGKPTDGSLDGRLYDTIINQPNPYHSLFNDTAAYFLSYNGLGTLSKRMPLVNSANFNNYSPQASFIAQSLYSYTSGFNYGEQDYNGVSDNSFSESEGWGAVVSIGSYPSSITINKFLSGGVMPTLETTISGDNANSHPFKVSVNSVDCINDTLYAYRQRKYNVNITNLSSGTATFNFAPLVDNNNTSNPNFMSIAYYRLRYPRSFDFSSETGAQHLLVSATADTAMLDIANFAGTQPMLYVFSGDTIKKIQLSVSANHINALVPVFNSEKHCYLTNASLTYSANGNVLIAPVSKDINHFARFTNLVIAGANADFLIVSNKRIWTGATQYANYRNQNGHTSLLVDIDEIYDQYAWGIEKHHLAIRNFCDEQIDKNQPKYLLLIGKSIMYNNAKAGLGYDMNLVPTFGEPASDNMYTAHLNSGIFKQELATGRISAQTDTDVYTYLDKLQAFELQQQNPQLWMKNVLHFGGGSDINEQSQFTNNLTQYREIIEDTLFGGNVTTFLKTSSAPIAINQSQYLQDLINGGVSMMTFFGHAAGSSFDNATDAPENYNNTGRYPLVLANSCYVGDIHTTTRLLNERFVLTPQKAAIAFMAVPDKGLADELHTFSLDFHKELFRNMYGSSIGMCMQKAVENILNIGTSLKGISMNMTLHGDPALVLNTFDKAEYSVTAPDIYFNPANVTTELDSFEVKIVLTNTGKSYHKDFRTLIERTMPDGTQTPNVFTTLNSISYKDTITIKMPVDFRNGAGLNTISVTVDVDNDIAEYDDNINNHASTQLLINSTDINPVYPPEFAIVPNNALQLKATTANLFATARTYRFQMDTTDKFTNPIVPNGIVANAFGVVSYQVPFTLDSDVVYYWRVANDSIMSLDTTISKKYQWKNSSFIYKPNTTGWSQAHFFQFKNDDYTNVLYVDSLRQFRFVQSANTLTMSHIGNNPVYDINGVNMDYGGCYPVKQLAIAVLDSIDFSNPWSSDSCQYYFGNYNFNNVCSSPTPHGCGTRIRADRYFLFNTEDPVQMDSMVSLIQNRVPNGDYILGWNVFSNIAYSAIPNVINAFVQLGATSLAAMPDNYKFMFFAKKGTPSLTVDTIGIPYSANLFINQVLVRDWDKGFIESKLIGPATQWQSMHWGFHSLEPVNSSDSIALQIYGVTNTKQEVLLINSIVSPNFDLYNLDTIVSANQYPYLKLRAYKQDESVNRTPPQLDKWQVYYQPVPEGTLNTKYFSLHSDTVQEGDNVSMSMAFENISTVPMDTLLVDYFLYDQSNTKHLITTKKLHRALPAGDTIMTHVSFNSSGYLGDNYLWIEANPHNAQPEQYHFNNLASMRVHVNKDVTNPLMDVTFDGVHILNGDIVSSKPQIIVQLMDENKFLALNDTASFRVYLTLKDLVTATPQYLHFETLPNISTNAKLLKWTPASLPKNSFRIQYNPEQLNDGVYTLDIEAADRSGNASGKNHYKISFEIINKSTITEIINYPNPFSTSTRFVFLLTGSEIPERMKIRIMTVTGKIVREITREELGNIHIGRNITDYAWNGKDEFGDQLANGVYLYQVVTHLHDEQIEHRDTNADSYFKKGWGKMYLMR